MPKVLVACEMAGRVRTQFAKRGWDAWSADLLPDESGTWNADGACPACDPCWGFHYKGDVLDIIREDWDLVIAHPPCTDLSQAGARYWAQKQADGRQREAISFFMKMYRMPRSEAYVVVENPRGIISQVFREPDQEVDPWWFGNPVAKKTCLWYRPSYRPSYSRNGICTRDLVADSLPLLVKDKPVEPTERGCTGGGSWKTDKAQGKTGMNNWEDSQGRARRPILRSLTPEGFARAAAEQWGSYVEARLARP